MLLVPAQISVITLVFFHITAELRHTVMLELKAVHVPV